MTLGEANTRVDDCAPCPAGTHKPKEGVDRCAPCAPGCQQACCLQHAAECDCATFGGALACAPDCAAPCCHSRAA